MVFRIFIASLLFDFLIWLPLFANYFKPWIINLHQTGAISYFTFTSSTLVVCLLPWAFMAITMGGYAYFENRTPYELKKDKKNKKTLVSVKAN